MSRAGYPHEEGVVSDCDLVTTSGRESMPIEERIGLLRADLWWLRGARDGIESEIKSAPRDKRYSMIQGASGAAIHDYNCLIGYVQNLCSLFDRAVARGTTMDALSRGAQSIGVSDAECRVLAFRRGGHSEYKRIQKAQIERDKQRRSQ